MTSNVYCYKIKSKKINVVIVLSEKVVYSIGNVYIGYKLLTVVIVTVFPVFECLRLDGLGSILSI